MSEIQTTYPRGKFHCKRCGQSNFRQEHIDRTNTGVNITEMLCTVCHEVYRIRWVQDRDDKPLITRRKTLCVDDAGHGYLVNWDRRDPPETANIHLADGRNAAVKARLARAGVVR